jgi:hypothetical protein
MSTVKLTQVTHPELNRKVLGRLWLQWSQHSLDRAYARNIDEVSSIMASEGSLVEMEKNNGIIKRIVVRVSEDSEWDISYVLVPLYSNFYSVVTVWRNHVSERDWSEYKFESKPQAARAQRLKAYA